MIEYIVILTHTKIEFDSRIQRQITLLSQRFNLIVGCQQGDQSVPYDKEEKIHYIYYKALIKPLESIQRMRHVIDHEPNHIFQTYNSYFMEYFNLYTEIYSFIKKNKYRVVAIICNDVFLLPYAYILQQQLNTQYSRIKLIGDMHEIHFDYSKKKYLLNERIRLWCADTYCKQCDLLISVSDWGNALYKGRYPDSNIITIRNVALYRNLSLSSKTNFVRLVHVGYAAKNRHLEDMLECMSLLPEEYTLDLYLSTNKESHLLYREILYRISQSLGIYNRVSFHDAVPPKDLVNVLNEYDIGIYYIKPSDSNQKYYLPNKLFEYIQARLAVVMTPLKSIEEVIKEYQVGEVSLDYSKERFVETIMKTNNRLEYYKKNSGKAAEILNAEKEWSKLINYIEGRIIDWNN